ARPSGRLVTKILQRLVVRRAEEPVAMEVSQEIEEAPTGEIARFRMVQRMAQNDVVVEGVVRGNRMVMTSAGPGARRSFEVPFNPLAVGPRRIERLLREKLKRSGDTASAVTFFPEKSGCGTLSATFGSEEVVTFPGGPRRLRRRTSRMDILPEVETHEWIDGEGKVWKTATQLLGMSIETYRSSSEEILREKYASLPEVFNSSSVRPNRPLKNPIGAAEVLYRFTLKKGDYASRKIDGMFRGTGQTLVREETPASRVVRIARVLPVKRVERPVKAPEGMEGCLAPSAFIQSDDPLIARLAKEAASGETDAFETARRLERWVRRNVEFKDLRTPFASAKEVAQRLEGDCTEHGVLLAALARASGIPARVVSGLVQHQGVF
ncbi:MAG: transglutaminase-like domain-containing protein, partial [Candidatus Methylomirabilales bacterium]